MTPEVSPRDERIELDGPGGLALKQLMAEDAQAYFDALHHNPSRFKYGEEATLQKYTTVEKVRDSTNDPTRDRL